MVRHILVVEDDQGLNDLVSRSIERIANCSCTSVTTGYDGLLAIADSDYSFELIVLDLSLPDVDGLEFIRRLVETAFKGSIVVASGHSPAVLKSAKRLAGYHGFRVLETLQKPFSPRQLKQIIENYTGEIGEIDLEESDRGRDISGAQLIPYYQPQINIDSGRIEAFEALIRLQLAGGPLVGPGALFSQIRSPQERVATALDISKLILKDVAFARRKFSDFPDVSINFDARVLEDDQAMAEFTRLVREAQIEPATITVEVIEKSLPKSDAQLLESLTRLSMSGFKISLDDYGVGGSNHDLLQRCPFDELKLDHTLIQSSLTDPVSKNFLAAAVQASQELDLRLVAEGVETPEHFAFVTEQGIHIVQGFLFEKPMPIEQALQFALSRDVASLVA